MWLKLRVNNGCVDNFTGKLICLWILICSALGRNTDYGYRRRHQTPRFKSASGNISFYVGATANLSCVIENLGARHVSWRKLPEESPITIGETIFTQDDRFSVDHNSERNNWDLSIKDLTFGDTGTYECQVPSKDKNIRQHIFLRVKARPKEDKTEPPPVISISGPDLTHVGDTLVIKCSATYIGVASIDWFFDGYLLQSSIAEGISIKDRFSSVSKTIHSTLQIKKATMSSSGTYTCRSADKYVKEYRITVLSDVKTNNKKRVISESLGKESSTSGQKSNTSSRVSINFPIMYVIMITWFMLIKNNFT
ncbi:zwei Ig domain protein zig-8-like [Mytilus californianus]|uniref:zwei Ig domain protein zig-8-like n=1 Tax=Mytilus californianus TaxID=6549 RepID=UPI002247B27F|nr:zwei Ig domain protein zig-8-like [Mytilus californianus]